MQIKESDNRNNTVLEEVEVTGNTEISPGVFLLSFDRQHESEAGQVIKIALDRNQTPRIYSICSGQTEKAVRILFNIKEDGYLTPKLAACIPGDRLWVSMPYGSFKGTYGPAWWIATGTGIAPFYSMFRSGYGQDKTLIHGVRFLNQFYFEDELGPELGESYIRCCSREKADGVFSGRVTDYLKNIANLPREVKYYICGKALMVVECRDLLIASGIPYKNIFGEIYF